MIKTNSFQFRLLKFMLTLRARISLYKRLSQFIEAQITLNESLDRIRRRYRQQTSLLEKLRMKLDQNFQPQGDFRAQILGDWIDRMADGAHFQDAIRPWIPTGEHMLIAAGVRGAGPATGMREAANLSMANSVMKKTIIGQSIQPVVLLMALVAMFILFQKKMVPIFKTLKPVAQWPSSAMKLYNISYFVDHYLLLVVAILVGIAYVIMLSLPRWRGKGRSIADYFPPWSIYRVQQSSAFLIGLSSLMEAGVTTFNSLQMMHRNGSPYLRSHLERMMANMSKGGTNLGASLNTGLLDQETAGNVEDYSQVGTFRTAIKEIGSLNLEESLSRIQVAMGFMKNLMLVLVAGVVLWIYATTYLLQANLANSVTSSPNTSMPH